jgi:uncharacterized membrane protein YccC
MATDPTISDPARPAACAGDCAACPALRRDGEAVASMPPPGGFAGFGLVGRCLLVFILPLLLAVIGGLLARGDAGVASPRVLPGVLIGFLVGVAIAIVAGRRWRLGPLEEQHRA